MKPLLGSETGDSVLRAGYSMGYNRPGTSDFTGAIADNPGVSLSANRNHALDNLGSPGTIFLRNAADLGPPANMPVTRVYPMTDVITGDITVFEPGPAGALRADLDGRLAAQGRQQHGRRSALRRLQVAAVLADLQLQRNQHRRERVPERVQGGAGQPGGEPGRGPREHVCVHRRGRHVAAADLPRALQRASGIRSRNHRQLHRDELDEHDVPRLPGRSTTRRRTASRTPATIGSSATTRSATTRSLPACPSTSGRRIPT